MSFLKMEIAFVLHNLLIFFFKMQFVSYQHFVQFCHW
jgi:hypothetical protein